MFFLQVEETAKLFYSNSFISINLYSYIAWGRQYQKNIHILQTFEANKSS